MAKQIEVLITATGEVKIKTVGFKGAECLKATEGLERALGKKSSDKATPEMQQTETKTNVGTNR